MTGDAQQPTEQDLLQIVRQAFADPAVNHTDATGEAVRGIQKARPDITASDALATVQRLLSHLR